MIESAFGRLKARFCIVLKRMEMRIDHVNAVVRACCTLHNICKMLNDGAEKQWVDAARNLEESAKREQPMHRTKATEDGADAVRDALVAYFEVNPPSQRG